MIISVQSIEFRIDMKAVVDRLHFLFEMILYANLNTHKKFVNI